MVSVQAPAHDVPFADVTPDESLSGWRAGIDVSLDAQELEDAMFDLVRKETVPTSSGLTLREDPDAPHTRVLSTSQSFKDGEDIEVG